jgi:predicted dienelactone hydrolase
LLKSSFCSALSGSYSTRCIALFCFLLLGSVESFAKPAHVGFAQVVIPSDDPLPLQAGVWYPTEASASTRELDYFSQEVAAPGAAVRGWNLPLIVISHGGGGSYASHYDTAAALAKAGFVAAAVSHRGDTYDDQSQVLKLWRRPAQLSRLIDFMLQSWESSAHLDRKRIGAFGFSNGGFTVLVTAGAVPDLSRIAGYCDENPGHDLCAALHAAGVSVPQDIRVPPNPWHIDPRVRSIVVAAPAFGFTFDSAGLAGVHVPVQLWGARDDHHQPSPWYEGAVRAALPDQPESHEVPNAGHYVFLPPCSLRLASSAPQICHDAPGFDRATFHLEFNNQVVAFFERTLRRAR